MMMGMLVTDDHDAFDEHLDQRGPPRRHLAGRRPQDVAALLGPAPVISTSTSSPCRPAAAEIDDGVPGGPPAHSSRRLRAHR
jgi:hypothetical protein